MKTELVRMAAMMCLALCGAHTEARIALPASGIYDGTIMKSATCILGENDRRMCHQLKVKLATGIGVDGRLWGGAANIYDPRGRYLYNADASPDASSGELREKFSKGVSYLRAGTMIKMKISCPKANCDIEAIQIKQ